MFLHACNCSTCCMNKSCCNLDFRFLLQSLDEFSVKFHCNACHKVKICNKKNYSVEFRWKSVGYYGLIIRLPSNSAFPAL